MCRSAGQNGSADAFRWTRRLHAMWPSSGQSLSPECHVQMCSAHDVCSCLSHQRPISQQPAEQSRNQQGRELNTHSVPHNHGNNSWPCVSVFFQVKAALSGSSYSDYLAFIRAVLGWKRVQHEGDREDRDEFLDRLSLSRFSLRFIQGHSAGVIICKDLTPHFTQGFCCVALMQVSFLSSARTCMRQSWCRMQTIVSVTCLSAMSIAMRRSCLKLYCWADSTPTLFR